MDELSTATQEAADIAAALLRLAPEYARSPLLDLPELACKLGLAQVLAKDESERALGSFKSLGGTYAGLRALARYAGTSVEILLANPPADLPTLLCASDGNHGLAVAAAARYAGAPAQIYLHTGVSLARARRIIDQGADIVWVEGTYDDAVERVATVARNGQGILVADTTDDPDDLVVADVMAGYGVLAYEIRNQVAAKAYAKPTHIFVQAGVGGLAAAIADGLADWMASPAVIIVVEPDQAPCVTQALASHRPIRCAGDLSTSAEMLACGEASTPALATLQRHDARAVTVSERMLADAPRILRACGGPATTTSGAAGLAGALLVCGNDALSTEFALDADSRILLLVTEGELGEPSKAHGADDKVDAANGC